MKIVLALGWYYPDSTGGTEAYVAALARRFAAGHEVSIAAPEPGAACERAYVHDGVTVFRYPVVVPARREERQGMAPCRGAELFHARLARLRPDVVHIHSFVPALGVCEAEAARAAGARVVATIHQPSLGYLCQRGTMMQRGKRLCDGIARPSKCAECVLHGRGLPSLLPRSLAALPLPVSHAAGRLPGKVGTALGMADYVKRRLTLQRKMLDSVDHLVLLTQWAFDAVAANGAPRAKLALNRLGVDAGEQAPMRERNGRRVQPPVRVGYLGRFEKLKGAETLARAIASLPSDVPLRVEFRGPVNGANDRSRLADLRAFLAGDRRVTFAPPVPPQDVRAVLAGYDLLCCPSECVEGGPTVALEALAIGTPVLGTRIGGLAEILAGGRGGLLVPPADAAALAAALRRVAADPEGTVGRWRRLLPRVRTMDEVAADYLEMYGA